MIHHEIYGSHGFCPYQHESSHLFYIDLFFVFVTITLIPLLQLNLKVQSHCGRGPTEVVAAGMSQRITSWRSSTKVISRFLYFSRFQRSLFLKITTLVT